jgi:hypothetical protein
VAFYTAWFAVHRNGRFIAAVNRQRILPLHGDRVRWHALTVPGNTPGTARMGLLDCWALAWSLLLDDGSYTP